MNSKLSYRIFLRLIVYILNHFIILQMQAQLSGEIIDLVGAPLSHVQVVFAGGLATTESNAEGKFSLVCNDTASRCVVSFKLLGYKQKTMHLNRGQRFVRVVLLDSVYELDKIVIKPHKYGRFSDYSAQTVTMSELDIATNPAAMADLLGNMRVLPGVQAADTDGRLIIQGGSPEESQVYINDLSIVNPYRTNSRNMGVRSRFTAALFEGVALQSGGYNAEFGQALSGIVNLNTKNFVEINTRTDLALSSVYTDVSQTWRQPSSACRVNLMYSDLALYRQLFPDDYHWNKKYREGVADFYIDRKMGQNSGITAQVYFSAADMAYSYETIDSLKLNTDATSSYLYAQVNFYHKISSRYSVAAASNLTVDAQTLADARLPFDKFSTLDVRNHNKLIVQYISKRIVVRTGTEYIANPCRETCVYGTQYRATINNNWLSLFCDAKLYFTAKLTANVGLRSEYSLYLRQLNFAPRLYFGYAPKPEHIFSVSLGRYFQLPSLSYLKISKDIDFVSVDKITVSYSQVSRSGKFQTDLYFKNYNNQVTVDARYGAELLSNSGLGTAYGVGVFWRNIHKSLEYWLMYSWNKVSMQYGRFLQRVAPDYVAEHTANITLKYWLARPMSILSLNCVFSSGTPCYSLNYPYSRLGTAPFSNSVSLSWSYLPKPWLIIHVGCQNILGHRNVYGYEYSEKYADLRREIVSPTRRFVFAGLFITVSRDKKQNQLNEL